MLELLRKHSRSYIIYVMFAIIILVFAISFGPGSNTCSRPVSNSVAEVGSVVITTDMLYMGMGFLRNPPQVPRRRDKRVNVGTFMMMTKRYAACGFNATSLQGIRGWMSAATFNRYAWIFGGENNPYLGAVCLFDSYAFVPSPFDDHNGTYVNAFFKHRFLLLVKEAKALNELIELYMVSDYAHKLGLRVDDAELREAVFAERFFVDGRFDQRRFRNFVVGELRTTPEKFKDFVRRNLMRLKLINYLAESISIPQSELMYHFTEENRKVGFEYVRFDPETVKKRLKVNDTEVDEVLKKNESELKKFYLEDVKATVYQIKLTPREMNRIEARERRLKLMQKLSAAEKDPKKSAVMKKQIERLEREIAALKKLQAHYKALAAKIHTELGDPTKPVDPKKVSKGKDGKPLPLLERFQDLAKRYSHDKRSAVNGGLVKDLRYRKSAEALSKAMVETAIGTISGVIEEKDGYSIIYVASRTPESFEKGKRELAKSYLFKKRLPKEVERQANAFLALAKKNPKKSLADAAKLFNAELAKTLGVSAPGEKKDDEKKDKKKTDDDDLFVEARTAEPFARVEARSFVYRSWKNVPKIGTSPDLARMLFAASLASPLVDKVIVPTNNKKRAFVVRVNKVVEADVAKGGKSLEKIRLRLQRRRASAVYRQLVDSMFDKMKTDKSITIDPSWLKVYANAVKTIEQEHARIFKLSGKKPLQLKLN